MIKWSWLLQLPFSSFLHCLMRHNYNLRCHSSWGFGFLKEKLAPAIKKIKEKKIIIGLDKGLALSRGGSTEIQAGEASNIGDAWVFPTSTAKFVNPLDNTLWHSLKERVRARSLKVKMKLPLSWKRSSWQSVRLMCKAIIVIVH